MYYNKLKIVDANMFKGLSSLERLEVSFNQIYSITNDTFKELNNLKYLIIK